MWKCTYLLSLISYRALWTLWLLNRWTISCSIWFETCRCRITSCNACTMKMPKHESLNGHVHLYTIGFPITTRKLVHWNQLLRLGHCDSWQKYLYINHFNCRPKDFSYSWSKTAAKGLQLTTKIIYLCIFSWWVTMAKSLRMVVMVKFTSRKYLLFSSLTMLDTIECVDMKCMISIYV